VVLSARSVWLVPHTSPRDRFGLSPGQNFLLALYGEVFHCFWRKQSFSTASTHIYERNSPLRNPWWSQHHGNTRTDAFRYSWLAKAHFHSRLERSLSRMRHALRLDQILAECQKMGPTCRLSPLPDQDIRLLRLIFTLCFFAISKPVSAQAVTGARRAARNIWSGTFVMPWDWRRGVRSL
jgi:hypothetical protein